MAQRHEWGQCLRLGLNFLAQKVQIQSQVGEQAFFSPLFLLIALATAFPPYTEEESIVTIWIAEH